MHGLGVCIWASREPLPAVIRLGRVLDRVPSRVASSASPRVAAFRAAAAAAAVAVPRPAAPSGAAEVEAAGAPPAVRPGGVGINQAARKGNGDRRGGAAKTSDAGKLGEIRKRCTANLTYSAVVEKEKNITEDGFLD